jgi:hypothetical protein
MFQCTHQSQEAYQRQKKRREGKPESLVSLEEQKLFRRKSHIDWYITKFSGKLATPKHRSLDIVPSPK